MIAAPNLVSKYIQSVSSNLLDVISRCIYTRIEVDHYRLDCFCSAFKPGSGHVGRLALDSNHMWVRQWNKLQTVMALIFATIFFLYLS